ncbi:hypothetical protein GX48_04132 [Paracoccidioides brasiliensis]|nr:hypothetical protein GX48_04132 [Paracoccidioides brasiliensis]
MESHLHPPIANKNVKKRSKSNPFAKTTERGQIRANLEMIRQDSRWRWDGVFVIGAFIRYLLGVSIFDRDNMSPYNI